MASLAAGRPMLSGRFQYCDSDHMEIPLDDQTIKTMVEGIYEFAMLSALLLLLA